MNELIGQNVTYSHFLEFLLEFIINLGVKAKVIILNIRWALAFSCPEQVALVCVYWV